MKIVSSKLYFPTFFKISGLRDIIFPYLWFSDGLPEGIEDTNSLKLLKTALNLPNLLHFTIFPVSLGLGLIILLIVLYLKFYAKANNQNLSKRKQIEILQNEKNEIRMENLKLRKEIGKLENNFCGKKYEMCPTNDITMPNTQ